ncbi:MAG: DNA polymerase/3'-5' exonuclease PolX [Thermoleophilia bacterium]
MIANHDIATALDQLADLMELEGVNRFKTIAVRKGARRVAEADFSIMDTADRGELESIPDIGEKLAAKITELIATGRMREMEQLLERYPAGLIQVMNLQGVGPRTARKLWDALGISSLDKLEAAVADGSVAALPGLGAKSAANMLKAITRFRSRSSRLLLGEVLPVAEELVRELARLPEAGEVTWAGSVRRMRETVKDLDIIATATEPAALIDAFARLPLVAEVIASGPTKCSIRTHAGLQVDLRVVPPGMYGNLLQHFTGSREHNVALRELAIARGLKVSEYGVTDTATGVARECATEAEVYGLLGLDFIPPELREDSGELAAAADGTLPDLVGYGDLKGDLHVHSDWSDGVAGIREMTLAAKERGFRYLAISDHSQSMGMVHGLTPERAAGQFDEIARLNQEIEGFHIFAGVELDVRADGTLDFTDEVLARFDFVTVSIHSGFNQGQRQIMQRLRAAMENPYVRSIGHPTGRLISRREAYEVDMDELSATAAVTGTALEINSHYNRLDLRDIHARAAQEAGVRLVINSDAHRPAELDMLRYGIATARRGWVRRSTVLNTLPLSQLKTLLKKPKAPVT